MHWLLGVPLQRYLDDLCGFCCIFSTKCFYLKLRMVLHRWTIGFWNALGIWSIQIRWLVQSYGKDIDIWSHNRQRERSDRLIEHQWQHHWPIGTPTYFNHHELWASLWSGKFANKIRPRVCLFGGLVGTRHWNWHGKCTSSGWNNSQLAAKPWHQFQPGEGTA